MSEPSDASNCPPCGMECSRVLQLEWQHDVDFWDKPGVNLNRNHLLLWMDKIPCDSTEWYPMVFKEAIAKDLVSTIRHRFRHSTTNVLLNTAAWNAYQTTHLGYDFIEVIDD
eukprot:9398953-Heterocapsa_arctica.AAC.1